VIAIYENEARDVISQLIDALEYTTDEGWVHRDLKLENIMFHKGKYIIGDWGFSRRFSYDSVIIGESFGSLYYAAPEIIKGDNYVGPECDIWSLGVILYTLVAVCLI